MFHQNIEWLLVKSFCGVLGIGSVPNEAVWQKSANRKRLKYHSPILQLLVWGWKLSLSYAGGASALRVSLRTGLLALILGWANQSSAALVLHCACLLVSYKCNRGHISMLPAWKHVFSFPFDQVSRRLMRLTAGGEKKKKKKVRDQEFIWKNEFTNDVCNLQKYRSGHEKKSEGRTD